MNTFEVGGDNAQQYAMLAQAMAKGQLYLEEEPPQWLKDMDDPYDKGARDEAQKETGEPYLFDVAYHDGHYYVYFGVVPVLLFYLPFYLLTGRQFPHGHRRAHRGARCSSWDATALLDRFARYHFKLGEPRACTCCCRYRSCSAAASCTCVKFPTFYSLPIMCGLAFSVWGLYCWMRVAARRAHVRLATSPGRCAWRSWLAAVPQLLVLSLAGLPAVLARLHHQAPAGSPRRGIVEFACLVAPYVLVAAGIMALQLRALRLARPTSARTTT